MMVNRGVELCCAAPAPWACGGLESGELCLKGVELGVGGKVGKCGRKLSYVATVQGNGNLLIGKAYTALLDLHPGDEFEIKLGRKQIRLIPVGSSEDDEE